MEREERKDRRLEHCCRVRVCSSRHVTTRRRGTQKDRRSRALRRQSSSLFRPSSQPSRWSAAARMTEAYFNWLRSEINRKSSEDHASSGGEGKEVAARTSTRFPIGCCVDANLTSSVCQTWLLSLVPAIYLIDSRSSGYPSICSCTVHALSRETLREADNEQGSSSHIPH